MARREVRGGAGGGGRLSLLTDDRVGGGRFGSGGGLTARGTGPLRASMDLDQLRDEFRRRFDSDSDDELDQFMRNNRQRFQQLFNSGGLDELRAAHGDRFKQLMDPNFGGEGGAGRLGVSSTDSGAAGLLDRQQRQPKLLGDRAALLSSRIRQMQEAEERAALPAAGAGGSLAKRANGLSTGVTTASSSVNSSSSSSSVVMNSSSSEVVNSSSIGGVRGAMLPGARPAGQLMSAGRAAGQLLPAGRAGQLISADAGSAGGPLGAPGVSSSRKQTFQESRSSSSSATFSQSMDGGPTQSNVTRVSQQQQLSSCTENGNTNVEQKRAQKVETAQVKSENGQTEVAAQKAQVLQEASARSRGDGTTEVKENVDVSGAARHATFATNGSGGFNKPVSVSGADFSARAQVDYVHDPQDGSGGQFKINSGDGATAGRRPPLWRFSAFGPLIQPPGGKIRGQVTMQTSQSMFNCQAGALPRYTGAEYAFQESFEVSESESDDDDLCLPAPARNAAARRRRQLGWRNKPALTYETNLGDDASEAPSEAPSEREAEVFDDELQAEEEARRRRERLHKIATELLTTERRYVQELHLIDQIFHFRVDQENRAHHMFNNEITAQMFSNVKSIYQFHKDHLLPQLEKRLENWENDPRIGDIMKTSAPFLKMYTEYVKNYDNAMTLINAFFVKCPRFAAIMEEIHGMSECGNLPLQHHMIVPIQRVPRYELLLKDYLQRLQENSPDLEDTKKALELVTHAATHSNEAMKRVEKFKQLLEIQENISGGPDLVSPTRQLVKEGKIFKISARSGDHQERYLFLFSDLLLLCSPRLINNRIISGPAYRLRAKFNIEGMQVLEGDNLETVNTFYINNNQKNVELYTQSPDEKADWLEALCNVITSFYERKASLKSDPYGLEELGKKAPVMLRQDGVSRCMDCESQFGMMRRKHGCKACGIVVCNKCSGQKVPLPCEDNKPSRVCNRCYQLLTARADTSATSAAPRRESILDVTYTRGKGILDVPASGDCLLSGYLQLRSRKCWSRRWFCLRADFVLYSYQTDAGAVALTATPVPGYTVSWLGTGRAEPGVPDRDRERAFKMHHARKSYVFLGDSKEDVGRWVAALHQASRAEALPQTQTQTAV